MSKQKHDAEKGRILRTFKSVGKVNQRIFLTQIICYSYYIFENMNFNIY